MRTVGGVTGVGEIDPPDVASQEGRTWVARKGEYIRQPYSTTTTSSGKEDDARVCVECSYTGKTALCPIRDKGAVDRIHDLA